MITGATGPVGRPLVDFALARGAAVRAVTRDPAATLARDVEVVVGDPRHPACLTDALSGVTALFLHPRAVGDAAQALVALARARGVRRVVALSAMNVDDPLAEQPSRLRGDRNREAEVAAESGGPEWTSLRASSFAGNTGQAWGAQLRAGDLVRYVHPGFEESLLDERDLAEVAALALCEDELINQRLELTGPQSLSHRQQVATIGRVLGRALRFEEVPAQAAAEGMRRAGLPTPFVDALLARYARHLHRPQHPPTGEVARILGRPARDYAHWVADHAAVFQP
ncbi:NAD(P)H-binding protein [Kitasatospora nipponensis]